MKRLKAVNFIPPQLLKRKRFFKARQAALEAKEAFPSGLRNAMIALLFLTALISAFPVTRLNFYRWNTAAAKRNIENAKAKLTKMQTQYLQFEKMRVDLSKEQSAVKQKMDSLSTTLSRGKKYSLLLSGIARIAPEGLWLERMTINENEIQVRGSTLDNQLITQFMNALDESRIFKNSRFISCEKESTEAKTIYNFQIGTESNWDPEDEPKALDRPV